MVGEEELGGAETSELSVKEQWAKHTHVYM